MQQEARLEASQQPLRRQVALSSPMSLNSSVGEMPDDPVTDLELASHRVDRAVNDCMP